jgi:uracil-DNA glycosylase
MTVAALDRLLEEVRACRICESHLPHGVRPVLRAGSTATILVAGQAPGRRVHESGIPFDDPSGDRLREWMGITAETFYDTRRIAIIPMGFCYPGTGRSGDLPPRPECAETWRARLLAALPSIRLTLAIGQYAIRWHVESARRNLTETVRAWREYAPDTLPLPHPSPRNNLWLRNNPWFEDEVLPSLRQRVSAHLQ